MNRSINGSYQIRLFHLLKYGAMLSIKKCPVNFGLFLAAMLAVGACTALNVTFKQGFFEAVYDYILRNEKGWLAYKFGIIMAVFMALTLAVQAAGEIAEIGFQTALQGFCGKELNRKAGKIESIVYEDSRKLDLVNKSYVGLEATTEVFTSFCVIGIREVAYFVFMGWYFLGIKPQLFVMFIFSFLPSLLGSFLRRRMHADAENEAAPFRRKFECFSDYLCNREYVKETRLWQADNFFLKKFRGNQNSYTDIQWQTEKHTGIIEILLRIMLLTGYVGTIGLLFVYMFQGEIAVGAFAAIFSSLDQLFDRMENVFNKQINNISKSFGQAQNYFAFLQLEEEILTGEESIEGECLNLENVSFAYPNSNRKALDNINLHVKKGETIAVVGNNGSGKSTLMRILMGLYRPSEGVYWIDGIDTRKLKCSALYSNTSAIFQKYQNYKMTVGQNVKISNVESKEKADVALEQASFRLENANFSHGIDTMLGKDFGGIDLSGGQWQRLAIARGLYRCHNFIILDEPTAAIDPLEESKLFQKFAEISKDKTAFIVTHRMGLAQIADRIVVMESGKVIEIGTHEELMKQEGKYKELFLTQAKWFVS